MKRTIRRYTFQMGLWPDSPRCTVRAISFFQAKDRCRAVMDRRYDRAGKEPPTTWTLEPIRIEEIK